MTVFLIAIRFDTQLLQEPFLISAHEFSECPHRLSRFVFKELFSFRSVQRTMCILGFLFFSSTLFLINHKKNYFLDIYYAYLPFFDRLLFKKRTLPINYRSHAFLMPPNIIHKVC